jgi:hypothetical protein
MAWLLIRVVAILAFANWGLYRADSTAFSFTHAPSFLEMLGNTVAGFYGGGAAGLSPESIAANALSVLTLVVGILMLGFLGVSTYLSVRATNDGGEIQELIAEVRREGARLNEKFRDEYEVSVAEATERLERLKFGLIGLVTAMSERIPDDFLDDGAQSAPAGSL